MILTLKIIEQHMIYILNQSLKIIILKKGLIFRHNKKNN